MEGSAASPTGCTPGSAARSPPALTGERRAVLEGIVLGDGAELSPGLRQDFQASGLYHILAVSGQNVVLVAAGALTLAWLVGLGRWVGEIGALAGIAGLRARGRPAALGDPRRDRRRARVARLADRPATRRVAGAAARGDRAARVESVRDLRPGLPALVRRGGGDLHGRPADRPQARADDLFPVASGWASRSPSAARSSQHRSSGCSSSTCRSSAFPRTPSPSPRCRSCSDWPSSPLRLDSFAPGAASVVAWLNGWTAAYIAFCARTLGSLPFAEITSTRALAVVAGILLGAAYLVVRRRRATAW